MVFATPPVSGSRLECLNRLDGLLDELGSRAGRAGPWVGPLRRTARAEAFGSSVEIEGFTVPPDRALEIVSATAPAPEGEDEQALSCYAEAMDHVATLARDRHFEWSSRVMLDLHFEACRSQRDRSPGLIREGPIFVTAPEGGIAYAGPEGPEVPSLLEELADDLQEQARVAHPVVMAAMAHLNLVSIHPFEDGNGRIARIVQSLALARSGVLAPELGSIEAHLARDTSGYYRVLREVQGGAYDPGRDAGPWVDYCVAAHIKRAETEIQRLDRAAHRWARLEQVIVDRRWDERLVIALEQALAGSTSRADFAAEAGVSQATASADLRRLTDVGLLERIGRGRTTIYRPTAALRAEADRD